MFPVGAVRARLLVGCWGGYLQFAASFVPSPGRLRLGLSATIHSYGCGRGNAGASAGKLAVSAPPCWSESAILTTVVLACGLVYVVFHLP